MAETTEPATADKPESKEKQASTAPRSTRSSRKAESKSDSARVPRNKNFKGEVRDYVVIGVAKNTNYGPVTVRGAVDESEAINHAINKLEPIPFNSVHNYKFNVVPA